MRCLRIWTALYAFGVSIGNAQSSVDQLSTSSPSTISSTGPVLVTSTAVSNNTTATVIWQITTFTDYENLKASTTITTTVPTTTTLEQTSTTTTQVTSATVVAVVFAGGIAWWPGIISGPEEITKEINPPQEKPPGKDDDPRCKLSPKLTCNNCGGRNYVGLCAGGLEIGCPCDCPTPQEQCTPESDKEEWRDGCSCTPLPQFDAADVSPDPTEPPMPTESEKKQAARDVLQDIWGGDVTQMPGYLAPPPPPPQGPVGDLLCFGTEGPSKGLGFSRKAGMFSLEHICGADGPTYSSRPDYQNGYAGERFWFNKDDCFCYSTSIKTAVGWWPNERKCIGSCFPDKWLRLSVSFSDDQTGCEPKKQWDIPKNQDCIDIFTRLVDWCDTDTTANKHGGIYRQHTSNGCVDWRMLAEATY